MGHQTLKRVPMNFNWPLHKVWDGYLCNLGGPCPEDGKTCFNGSTAAGKWLEAIARLIALAGDEAAVAPHADELRRRGRNYPHPYLEEWSQAPRYETPREVMADLRDIPEQRDRMAKLWRYTQENPPKLLPLTDELVELAKGLGARGPGELGNSDCYYIICKLQVVAGLPKTWGVCPVCEGHGDDPTKRAAAEAWEPTEPPNGNGWQLWETCSEGSPVSPVFTTSEELADWCAVNATTFADFKATREQWLTMFASEDGADVGSMGMMVDGKMGAAVDFGYPQT